MTDRRPVASRRTGWARWLARVLTARGITPNQISIASMVFALLAGLAFYVGAQPGRVQAVDAQAGAVWHGGALILGALCCQLRLICNLMDGLVAVEGGKGRPDGAFWNEAPDRVSDLLILVGLGYGLGLPALGWAAGALAVSTAYIRELGRATTGVNDFAGPMAKPQRMAVITGAAVLAALTPAVAAMWVSEAVLVVALWVVALGSALTGLRRSATLIARLRG